MKNSYFLKLFASGKSENLKTILIFGFFKITLENFSVCDIIILSKV